MLVLRNPTQRGRQWKQLSSTKLPHHSVRAVWLNGDVIHHGRHHHPQPMVLRASGRKPEWSPAGHSSNSVGLPHHVVWLQPIELRDIHGVCTPRLHMCPRLLQNYQPELPDLPELEKEPSLHSVVVPLVCLSRL